MKNQKIPTDRTAMVPFVIFGILMALVAFSIIKGTHKGDINAYRGKQNIDMEQQ